MQLFKKLWLAPILLLAACSGQDRSENYGATDTTVVATQAPTAIAGGDNRRSATAVVNPAAPLNSPDRKIARTADIRCQVANALNATMALERLTKQLGGAMLESALQRTYSQINTTAYKADSLRETKTSVTTATMTIRVPSDQLDTLLQALPALATTVESRTIKQQDLTYSFVANELRNKAAEQANSSGMAPAPRRSEALETQQYKDAKTDELIDRKINNLQILDNVAYATITVALTEPEAINQRAIPNPDYYAKTPLTIELRNAFVNGWEIMAELALIFISIWPLLLLAAAIWLTIKKTGRFRWRTAHK